MRARHQLNSVPGARVYGSPSISQPPMQASNSPNGWSLVDRPRRGDSYGQVSMAESLRLSHGTPASSTITSAPARVRAWAAMPPPAPEPTMHTSYTRDSGLGARSYGASLHGLSQRGEGVARRHELVRHVSAEPGVGDGGSDRVPVELLCAVQLVATGHAAGVEVSDEGRVVANRPDDVAFHDLHVIDVVQQLHARRRHALHHGDPERRVVSLVVLVIDLAVQERSEEHT